MFLTLYMGHNLSSDTTPKNKVVRSGSKIDKLESYRIVLSTKKKLFRFDKYLLKYVCGGWVMGGGGGGGNI